MTRESANEKAGRLLAGGSIAVILAVPGLLDATVRGDHGLYAVTYRRGGFSCSCPAFGRCAHLLAVLRCTSDGHRVAELSRWPDRLGRVRAQSRLPIQPAEIPHLEAGAAVLGSFGYFLGAGTPLSRGLRPSTNPGQSRTRQVPIPGVLS